MKLSLFVRTHKKTVVGGFFTIIVSLNPAIAQKPRKSIELTRLISMYMLPSSAKYNVLDWSTGSEPGTAVSWQHAGIRDCDRFALGVGVERSFCRTGNVVVTVAGKPTHTILSRVLEPGKWKVTLGGARSGVDYVNIDADVLSQDLDSQVLVTAANRANSGVRLRQISRCGSDSSGGAVTFSINVSGKKDAVVRQWWSCGSGGCNVILTLVPDREDAGDLTRCN